MRTQVTGMYGIEYPIFAFSHCRDVVAAVSRAGVMGMLGALYFTPEELELELSWLDANVGGRPYGVDVVMPASYEGADLGDADELLTRLQAMIPEQHREFVDKLLVEQGMEPLTRQDAAKYLIGWTDATARPQVEVALRHPIALLANALDPPPADVVEMAHAKGVKVAAATSRDTVRSRSLTGKTARLLKNTWTDAWERPDAPQTLPMPMRFMLVSDAMRCGRR
ncbi:MAG: hypothetical protein GEV11_28215, partial [Streptosporangiales bacterium]|nr:hypothetical protein [Streptosporangiales bacterium]